MLAGAKYKLKYLVDVANYSSAGGYIPSGELVIGEGQYCSHVGNVAFMIGWFILRNLCLSGCKLVLGVALAKTNVTSENIQTTIVLF